MPEQMTRAEELNELGGIPEKRAQVVALIEKGFTHQEVADELGMEHRSEVGVHVDRYRNQDLPGAKWLVEKGPRI
ncbi:helix-turn-helix domain-containing protein [Halocatena halophila]|uniref:helix-turn-helix domain-containing protein n=1 Tax=Halocatena halophila TaxID=2814576 RepID=UPI002ED2EFF6